MQTGLARPRSSTNSSNMATGFAGLRTLARIQTTACKQAINYVWTSLAQYGQRFPIHLIWHNVYQKNEMWPHWIILLKETLEKSTHCSKPVPMVHIGKISLGLRAVYVKLNSEWFLTLLRNWVQLFIFGVLIIIHVPDFEKIWFTLNHTELSIQEHSTTQTLYTLYFETWVTLLHNVDNNIRFTVDFLFM